MSNLHSIFDISSCISQKQMQDYLHGKLPKEEAMLVESHISSCALCSDAIDGYLLMGNNTTTFLPESAKDDFLKKVYELNVATKENTPTENIITPIKKESSSLKLYIRKWSIAAGILLILSTGIFTVYSYFKTHQGQLAKNKKSGNNKVASNWEKTEDKSTELVKIKVSPQENIVANTEENNSTSKNADIKTSDKNISRVNDYKPTSSPISIETKANNELDRDNYTKKDKMIAVTPENTEETKSVSEEYAAVQNNNKEAAAPMVEKPTVAMTPKPAAAGMRNMANDNNMQSNAPPVNVQYTELSKNKKMTEAKQAESTQKNEMYSPYDKALQLYNSKEYTKCIEQLKIALNTADATTKEDIYYYLALCYENTLDEQNALVYWNKLTNSNKYKQKAEKNMNRAKKK